MQLLCNFFHMQARSLLYLEYVPLLRPATSPSRVASPGKQAICCQVLFFKKAFLVELVYLHSYYPSAQTTHFPHISKHSNPFSKLQFHLSDMLHTVQAMGAFNTLVLLP